MPLVEQELVYPSGAHEFTPPILVEFVLLNLSVEFDTTGATSRAGTATLSEHTSFTSVCSGVPVAESLAFCL